MTRSTCWLIFGAFVVLGEMPLQAQETPEALKPGEEIRITNHGRANPYRATFRRSKGDTLILQVEGVRRSARIPLGSIRRLEVRRRGKGHPVLGAVLGGAAGIAAVSALPGDPPGFNGGMTAFWAGGMPGLVLGALVGRRLGSSRWESLDMDKIESPPKLILRPVIRSGGSWGVSGRIVVGGQH